MKIRFLLTLILVFATIGTNANITDNILSVNTLLKKCINSTIILGTDSRDSFTIKDISIKKDGAYHVIFMDCFNNEGYKKLYYCTINIPTPFYVYNGEWKYENERYTHEGDFKIVTISNNPSYGDRLDFKQYDYNNKSYLNMDKLPYWIKIDFKSSEYANNFVNEFRKLQDKYYAAPWEKYLQELQSNQGISSKEIFEQLANQLSKYKISSEQVRYYEEMSKTSNVKIKYHNNILTITYKDSQNGFIGPNFKSGWYSVHIPIRETSFNLGSGFLRSNEEISMYCENGIEVIHGSSQDLVESVSFYGSRVVCKNIISKLKTFKRKIIEEQFNGSYGVYKKTNSTPTKSSKQKVSGKKISDKYEQ